MKITRTVTIDLEVWEAADKLGINISEACNNGLKEAVAMGDATAEASALRSEAASLLNQASAAEAKASAKAAIQAEALREFMGDKVGCNVIFSEAALNFWAAKTGKTPEELIKVKRGN